MISKSTSELNEENQQLKKQIAKFKEIAKHVQEHCCDDCEDNSMCEFGCAITELKLSLISQEQKLGKQNE
jgi:radical SAM protein with 4Fe4S-binding SPASM domain